MDKNIEAYIKYNNHILFPADLVWRIVGIFFFNFIILVLTQLLSPIGTSGFDLTSKNTVPIEIVLVIISVVVSAILILLYNKKEIWSFFAIRFINMAYFSVALLIQSVVRYNGVNYHFQDFLLLTIKVVSWLALAIVYPIIIKKKVIPKFSFANAYKGSSLLWIAPLIVVSITAVMRSSTVTMAESTEIMTLFTYMFSVMSLMYSITLFIRTYYCKKYVTSRKFGIIIPKSKK